MSLPPPPPLPSLSLPPPPLPLLTSQYLPPPPATLPIYTHHPPIPPSLTLPPHYVGTFPSQHPLSFPSTTQQTNYTTPITPIPTTSILPTPKPPTLTTQSHTQGRHTSKGLLKHSFRVGEKSFFLVFDGGRTAPYHIIEKRGKFVGSLWLGVDNLRWVLQTLGLLQKSSKLKGFFRFNRTEYSTLEFSCLQNQRGRLVELCEYHGGAQRGGIRVPEGYLGKGWHRFAEELNSFFLGKQPPVEVREGRFHNGKLIPNRKVHDSRDPTAKISHQAGNVTSTNSVNLNPFPRVILDPNAVRPTRKYEFEWKPRAKTLRITKTAEGKRQVEWVGLKYKAQGLIQRDNRAFTQVPCNGPREPVAFDGPGEPVRNDQSPEHVDEAVLDQLHTQAEIQVEIEPTSIQSFKDPVSTGGFCNWMIWQGKLPEIRL
jgi:hypothetical protein